MDLDCWEVENHVQHVVQVLHLSIHLLLIFPQQTTHKDPQDEEHHSTPLQLLRSSTNLHLFLVFGACSATNMLFLNCSMDVQLTGHAPPHYVPLYGLIFAGGVVFSPFLGALMQRSQKSNKLYRVGAFIVALSLSASFGCTFLIPTGSVVCIFATFVVISLYRTSLFAFWLSYLMIRFGARNFGQLYGVSIGVVSAMSALTFEPLLHLAVVVQKSFFVSNLIMGAVGFFPPLFVVWAWRRRAAAGSAGPA